MATTIKFLNDTMVIDRVFVSGKDRVKVNDRVLYEGKFGHKKPEVIADGTREYTITRHLLNAWFNTHATHVVVKENGEVLHDVLYDVKGRRVKDVHKARAAESGRLFVHVCGSVGSFAALAIVGINGGFRGDILRSAVLGGCVGLAGAVVGTGFGYVLRVVFFPKER